MREHTGEDMAERTGKASAVRVNTVAEEILFDWDKDRPGDVIRLTDVQLKKSRVFQNTYLYGYEVTNAASVEQKQFFSDALKSYPNLNVQGIETSDFERFIVAPIDSLQTELGEIDCVVYPMSSYPLVVAMLNVYLKKIVGVESKNMISFQLLKKACKDIEFDREECEKDLRSKGKTEEEINRVVRVGEQLASRIRRRWDTDFSASRSVISEVLRNYLQHFLYFSGKDSDRARNAIINGHVLILDDTATTAATIISAIRAINTLAKPEKPEQITIYTCLGKQYKALGG